MTNIGSLSTFMFAAANPITLILLCLPLVDFSSFRWIIFFGKALKTNQTRLRCRYRFLCNWLEWFEVFPSKDWSSLC